MSGKFIHTFTDENPELQKQIGCMSGIFQMFDRHHLLTPRRLSGQSHKRLPPGNGNLNSSVGADRNVCSTQKVPEKNSGKSTYENRRVSMESSRTSFSSSSCSSFSSLEYSKSTQKDLPTNFSRTTLPDGSSTASPKLKNSEDNVRLVNCEHHSNTQNTSVQAIRQSLDFRDVVKDSMYRDTPRLSVKISTKEEEVKTNRVNYRDSPRPAQLSKSMDGSYMIGMNGKSRVSVELDESLRIMVKLNEAPWQSSEAGEPPRSSYEAKEALVSRDAPRFSYDRRRASLDSRERSTSISKLKELPRLSLDSREDSLRNSNFDSKPNSILNDLDRRCINQDALNPRQELSSHKRSPSVVAKLMGLEVLPNMSILTQEPIDSAKTKKVYIPQNVDGNQNLVSKSLDATQESKQDRLSPSPRNSIKDPAALRPNKSDSVMKPTSNSRAAIETAPWRQPERTRVPQKATAGYRDAHFKQPLESVCSEIEKRLKELEFQQSNKDLRALKQILDAMQAKGLLEIKNGEKQQSGVSVRNDQNLKSSNSGNHQITRGTYSPKAFESPIVIMKPAKFISGSGISASSVIPLEGLSGLRKLRTSDPIERNKAMINSRVTKDLTPKASSRGISNQPLLATNKSIYKVEESNSQRTHSRTTQGSSKPQQPPKENSGTSVKSPSALSPRLQQRKLEAERKSRPPLPSSDSNRPTRVPSNKQQSESVSPRASNKQQSESASPRGKLRRKPTKVEENDNQLSETSETRNLGRQGDEVSLKSESSIRLASQVDVEVTSAERSTDAGVQQRSPRLLGGVANKNSSVLKQKKSLLYLEEEVSSTKLAAILPEQPSPISVLDPFPQEVSSVSPVKKFSDAFEYEETRASVDNWNRTGEPNAIQSRLTSEINHKKLQSIQDLVQKLSKLSSGDDKASTTDHIASLCETQNPDHRYVSEILLASGLLLRDLSHGPMGPMPIQLHPSGHPINPDLFLVIEQTKCGWLSKPELIQECNLRPNPDLEKLHRKLMFDVINEYLIQKLELTGQGTSDNMLLRARKFPRRFPSGQRLLKELCSDIDRLQAEHLRTESTDEDSNMAGEQVLRPSEGWTDFGKEVPGIVLEIERLIFKDLIDEVAIGEAASGLQLKPSRRRRQLFPK